uniref:NNMT/PNMT/TEMT family protein n=1 Tax=Rhabditophanes sp. KR3021 TaxID=114890 RepID=A0AC35TXT1_9BILA
MAPMTGFLKAQGETTVATNGEDTVDKATTAEEGESNVMMFTAKDYDTEFDAAAYLKFYYSDEAMQSGTRLSLFALPMFAHIIKDSLPDPKDRQSFIDVGSGPTVYSALCFRDVVERIYLTDYVDHSLEILDSWVNQRDDFNWESVIKIITRTEGAMPPNKATLKQVEDDARKCVQKGGILRADVHTKDICNWEESGSKERVFDILCSVFCLESACETYQQYKQCIHRMSNLIRNGGRLIIGSVIEERLYTSGVSKSGKSTIFSLLNLTRAFIMECLEEAGMDMTTFKEYCLENQGVLFLMVTKK